MQFCGRTIHIGFEYIYIYVISNHNALTLFKIGRAINDWGYFDRELFYVRFWCWCCCCCCYSLVKETWDCEQFLFKSTTEIATFEYMFIWTFEYTHTIFSPIFFFVDVQLYVYFRFDQIQFEQNAWNIISLYFYMNGGIVTLEVNYGWKKKCSSNIYHTHTLHPIKLNIERMPWILFYNRFSICYWFDDFQLYTRAEIVIVCYFSVRFSLIVTLFDADMTVSNSNLYASISFHQFNIEVRAY